MNLDGRVALVTGGRRMGTAVASELARRGADVGFSYHASREQAEQAATAVRALGRRAAVLQADLGDPSGCAGLLDAVASALGRIDVLVNMASVYRATPLDQLTADDWRRQMRVDLDATWFCSLAAVPHMRRQGGGRIINFADWVARSGRPRYRGYATYYVAKAGVIAITEVLALELASDGILVNAIAPGPILAPDEMSAEEVAQVERTTPLGRWGGEEEIAKAIAALIDADFITGETIRVDGGRHLK